MCLNITTYGSVGSVTRFQSVHPPAFPFTAQA
jgi:hypothetical protein